MAVDGSFSLESELKRFLHRCPKLKPILCFSNLLEKGGNVTEGEVVHAAGQLLLHPNYTIPLLGCFRPIAQKIVERTVALLLLVPSLRTDDDSCMVEFDEDEFLRGTETVDSGDVASVIDIYVRYGKCLRLHELASLAFCRALDLIPFLLGSILSYFKAAPAPFERIMQCEPVSKALAMGANQLLNVVRASYRLLIMEPDVFIALWDWSCYLDLIQHCTYLISENDGLRNVVLDIRWCSVGILSLVLQLSFKASANLGLDSEEALESLMRWQEFCAEISLEKGSWYLEASLDETLAMIERKASLKEGHCLKSCRLNSLSTSSSMAHEIVPSNQTSLVDPW